MPTIFPSRLQKLALKGRLGGTLSPNINSLADLRNLIIHGQLTGTVPPLPSLTLLNQFDIVENDFTGTFPVGVINTAKQLTVLQINGNLFTGTIPSLAPLTLLIKWYFPQLCVFVLIFSLVHVQETSLMGQFPIYPDLLNVFLLLPTASPV